MAKTSESDEYKDLLYTVIKDILYFTIRITEDQKWIIVTTSISTTYFSIEELKKYTHDAEAFIGFIKEKIRRSIRRRIRS